MDPSCGTYEQRRSPSPADRAPHDLHCQRSDTRGTPPPEVEAKVTCGKEPTQEDEDCEMQDLVRRIHELSIREESYAMLYARCAHRFPNVARCLPRPMRTQCSPTPPATATSFLQTPAPPPQPTQQPRPVAANPLSSPHLASDTSSFRPNVQSGGHSFCLQPGHRVLFGNQLHLPNGQLTPSDSAGREVKHSIDARQAAQVQVTPAPAQQVSFTREAPPRSPPNVYSRAPSACIKEGQNKGSDSGKEDPFFHIFAAEKKKCEIRRSRPPELHPSAPSTSTSAIPSALAPPISAAHAVYAPPAPVPAASAVPSMPAAAASPTSTTSAPARPAPSPQQQPTAEDQATQPVAERQSLLMEGKWAQTSPAHIPAASPAVWKDLVDKLQVFQVETTGFEEAARVQAPALSCQPPPPPQPPPQQHLIAAPLSLPIHVSASTFPCTSVSAIPLFLRHPFRPAAHAPDTSSQPTLMVEPFYISSLNNKDHADLYWTGDGQDFKPPGGVRWAVWLRVPRPEQSSGTAQPERPATTIQFHTLVYHRLTLPLFLFFYRFTLIAPTLVLRCKIPANKSKTFPPSQPLVRHPSSPTPFAPFELGTATIDSSRDSTTLAYLSH